jgi:hypothetical protein
MLYEQAFYSLPEFLVGTGFTRYDAEGTLVMAFSMAVLQELNGRNINNPVSLINAERHYAGTSSRTADLHVNQTPIGLLNSSLSAFGVRQEVLRCFPWLGADSLRGA